MPARHVPATHDKATRDKIQKGRLLILLETSALGETPELSSGRLKAIEILLRKCIPDLSAVELSGPEGGPIHQRIERHIVDHRNPDSSNLQSTPETGSV